MATSAVARLDRGALPWQRNGEKPRARTRLYYQIVLGTVRNITFSNTENLTGKSCWAR